MIKIGNREKTYSNKKNIKRGRLINKKGSSLILALVVIALISILSTLVVTLSLNAYRVSVQTKWADEDFFYCEDRIEEVRREIVLATNDIIISSYTSVMGSFSDEDFDFINTSFKENIRNEIRRQETEELNGDIYKALNGTTDVPDGRIVVSYDSDRYSDSEIYDYDFYAENKYVFKDVRVEFINESRTPESENPYYASITTDIIIEIPELPDFNREDYFGSLSYIFVSGTDLAFDGSVEANGNVYALQNLVCNSGANVSLNSDYVTVGGQINNNTNFTIFGMSATASIWCKDVILSGSGETTIFGNSFVADDLEINAPDTNVLFSGKYYGYTDGQSAILVNGKGTTLDMTNVDELVLKGHSMITSNYPGAESLATIVSQSLYMVGRDYIDFSGKQIKIKDGQTCSFSNIKVSDDSTYTLENYLNEDYSLITGGINLSTVLTQEGTYMQSVNTFYDNYLTTSSYDNGEKKMVVLRVDTTNKYCYLYWNFADVEKGNTFVTKCIEAGLVDGFLDSFMDGGKIEINESASVLQETTLYGYKATGDGGYEAVEYQGTFGVLSEDTINGYDLVDRFSWYKATLQPEKYAVIFGEENDDLNPLDTYSSTIFRPDYINMHVISESHVKETDVYGLYESLLIKGNLNITSDYTWKVDEAVISGGDILNDRDARDDKYKYEGIIFVDGDVTIEANIDFTGMIVATGTIKIKGGTYTADEEIVKGCLNVLENTLYSNLVADDFFTKTSNTVTASTGINADDYVKYENWTRNKDKVA